MKLLLSVLLAAVSLPSYAQIGFGVEAGLNASDYNIKISGNTKKTDYRLGMRLGAISDIALSDNFYFQPGIFYVANGYRSDLLKGYEQYTLNTIEVPLNIQYKIGILGTNRLFVGIGPYVAFNRSGSYQIEESPVSSKRALRLGTKATDDIKYFDFGGGINVGYQITEGLFVRLRSQLGLTNLMPTSNTTAKSLGFCLSAGYLFYRRGDNGQIIINRKRENKL